MEDICLDKEDFKAIDDSVQQLVKSHDQKPRKPDRAAFCALTLMEPDKPPDISQEEEQTVLDATKTLHKWWLVAYHSFRKITICPSKLIHSQG